MPRGYTANSAVLDSSGKQAFDGMRLPRIGSPFLRRMPVEALMTAPLTTQALLARFFARVQPGPKRRNPKPGRGRCPLCQQLVDVREGIVLRHSNWHGTARCLGTSRKV
jgi:hypothetical protein